MGPEWSPGLENRPPGMPRLFPSLRGQSRGQTSAKKNTQLPVWGLALGSLKADWEGKEQPAKDAEARIADLEDKLKASEAEIAKMKAEVLTAEGKPTKTLFFAVTFDPTKAMLERFVRYATELKHVARFVLVIDVNSRKSVVPSVQEQCCVVPEQCSQGPEMFRTCRTMFRTFQDMLAKMDCWPRDM